ncbi:MAG: type ISP restriction/modification enzyme [Gammaproteobacteria bacterium]
MPRSPSAQMLAAYLREMQTLRAVATPEISYYPALQELLLNRIGEELRPKVKSIPHPSKTGEGLPDFGLCTTAQLKRLRGAKTAEKPDRGAIEVKPLSDNLDDLIRSEQTEKYARSCGIVLACNYREFALVELQNGKIEIIARCQIAASEKDFWQKTEHPQKTGDECGGAVCEFLRRALAHNAPITRAEDVAANLASFAREALAALENNKDETALLALRSLREDLESALSMQFSGESGGHFLHSTLAQTIFYGMFSAWMKTPQARFNWRREMSSVNTPVMRALFSEITNPDRLGRLGLEKSLDGAEQMLNRVPEKESIFGEMGAAAAVFHFYEPFLAEFDPQLRKDMGVWYTPPEIVRYMVERADRVLRTELNIAEGLAADNVHVLDPCGGTGAYIAEVLRRIHKTCKERGDGANAARLVKEAAQKRIIGFEILSASYVIAHWQIGALLAELGAPLEGEERSAVYLTNSLTDWTPSEQPHLNLPGLEEERDAANKIKQEKPILVILGNPPYNAYAGTSPQEEKGIVDPYKKGLQEWGVNAGHLNDLYVRFFRMAENRITKTGRGIVSFISNYSYTEEPAFVVMRQSLLKSFDKFWIENMHGDRNKSERAPDGNSSNTIFSMRGVSPGIRQGVVVALALKTSDSKSAAKVQYRNDIDAANAEERRAQLLASLDARNFDSQYEIAKPQKWNKLSFRPLETTDNFLDWTDMSSLCAFNSNGAKEGRGGAMIDSDKNALVERMRDYFNSGITWEDYLKTENGLTKDTHNFNAKKMREIMLIKGFKKENITHCTMRPLDDSYCYYPHTPKMWNAARPELYKQFKSGNSFIVSRSKNNNSPEGAPVFFTNLFGNRSAMSDPRYIPFHVYSEDDKTKEKIKTANLSGAARAYLAKLKFPNPDTDSATAEILWLHALAVCYSPQYQTENADGLKIGWPRIPLPQNAETLKQSAALGKKIRDLLDMQTPLNWQTPQGKKLATLAVLSDASDLSAADWWGYKDGKGKTYPGKGKIEPMPQPPEYAEFAQKLGAPQSVKLNKTASWEPVPERAWQYRIGGFQPAKKWLSYRAKKVLGRDLHPEKEIRIFPDIIRRLSALILLEEDLDENYKAAKEYAATKGARKGK